jgi:hypothetical protein
MRTASAHSDALRYDPDFDNNDCADSKLSTPVPGGNNGGEAKAFLRHASRRCTLTCCAPDGSPLQGALLALYRTVPIAVVLFGSFRSEEIHRLSVAPAFLFIFYSSFLRRKLGQSFIIDKEGALLGRKISNTIPLLMRVRKSHRFRHLSHAISPPGVALCDGCVNPLPLCSPPR